MTRFLYFSLLIYGCQTVPPIENLRLPPAAEAAFAPCGAGDGALLVKIYTDNQLAMSGELEWLAAPTGWKWELTSMIGQRLLRTEYAAPHVVSSGPLAAQLPEIATDAEGFLMVEGHFIGLKAAELACLMSFKFPRSWLAGAIRYDDKEPQAILEIAETRRQIRMNIARNEQQQSCARISWGGFLGLFRRNLDLCYPRKTPKEGAASGLADYVITWKWVHEGS